MIQFIDEHRDRFRVEFLCRTLRAAVRGFLSSRGYRAAKSRPTSVRRLRDELLVSEIPHPSGSYFAADSFDERFARLTQSARWERRIDTANSQVPALNRADHRCRLRHLVSFGRVEL